MDDPGQVSGKPGYLLILVVVAVNSVMKYYMYKWYKIKYDGQLQ